MNQERKDNDMIKTILWIALPLLVVATPVLQGVFAEITWIAAIPLGLLVLVIATLITLYRKAFKGRSIAFGAYSLMMALLLISIVGVVNFIGNKYPKKIDMTSNKMHTLSEQTVKILKELKTDVRITVFGTPEERESHSMLLENYRAISNKFQIEHVNPIKEPLRVRQAQLKMGEKMLIQIGTREKKLEEISEEKITNALLKLTKDRAYVFCTTSGQGERSLSEQGAEGYAGMKQYLTSQSYETEEINLLTETKIPEKCGAIGIIGPTRGFDAKVIDLIKNYLENGGRAMISIDPILKGEDTLKSLTAMLENWYVQSDNMVILDPAKNVQGMREILATNDYSKDHVITKEMSAKGMQGFTIFPTARPLEIKPGAPADLKITWLAQTSPVATKNKLIPVGGGKAKPEPVTNAKAPFYVALAVDGKLPDSKASRNTRMVIFGSSLFANNNYAQLGLNPDFFLNAAGWLVEDEASISIRPKEESSDRLFLSQTQIILIRTTTVFIVPFLIAVTGIVIWVRRRKL